MIQVNSEECLGWWVAVGGAEWEVGDETGIFSKFLNVFLIVVFIKLYLASFYFIVLALV